MKTSILILALSMASVEAQDVARDPRSARIVVDDVRRLAAALDSLNGGGDTLGVLRAQYLAPASLALRAYAERHAVTAESLRDALRQDPMRYRNLTAWVDTLVMQEGAVRAGLVRLAELLPRAVYPTIWLIAAHGGPAGMSRQEGAILAVERYRGRAADIVPLALHEVTHFQQAVIQGPETYARLYGSSQTLLGLALREGVADLVAELTTGSHINMAAQQYGISREAELWAQFRRDMGQRDPGDWMFVRPADGRPPDLGYWMGYRIAKSFYARATDKTAALITLLAVTDFPGFLTKSGYAPPPH